MGFGADPSVLEDATRRLVAELRPEKVYLFGSRARGDAAADGDYDFLVVLPSSGDSPFRRSQRAHRALSDLGVSKDVVIVTPERFEAMKGLESSLEHEVATEGRLLYG